MQPYEPSQPRTSPPHQSRLTGLRETSPTPSPSSDTPIYDSLYAEYRRLFRALPGDRSDEEELRFKGFGTVHGTGTGRWGDPRRLPRSTGSAQPPVPLPPVPLPPARDGHRYGF